MYSKYSVDKFMEKGFFSFITEKKKNLKMISVFWEKKKRLI